MNILDDVLTEETVTDEIDENEDNEKELVVAPSYDYGALRERLDKKKKEVLGQSKDHLEAIVEQMEAYKGEKSDSSTIQNEKEVEREEISVKKRGRKNH